MRHMWFSLASQYLAVLFQGLLQMLHALGVQIVVPYIVTHAYFQLTHANKKTNTHAYLSQVRTLHNS